MNKTIYLHYLDEIKREYKFLNIVDIYIVNEG